MHHLTIVPDRPPAILDLSALTKEELSVLAGVLRNAQQHSNLVSLNIPNDAFAPYESMWRELLLLRLEVRGAYLRRMFTE